jgi:hypothetical protein
VTAASIVSGPAGFGQYGPYFHLLDTYRDLPC